MQGLLVRIGGGGGGGGGGEGNPIPGGEAGSGDQAIKDRADEITGTAKRGEKHDVVHDINFYPVNERIEHFPYRQLEFAVPTSVIPKRLTYEFNAI